MDEICTALIKHCTRPVNAVSPQRGWHYCVHCDAAAPTVQEIVHKENCVVLVAHTLLGSRKELLRLRARLKLKLAKYPFDLELVNDTYQLDVFMVPEEKVDELEDELFDYLERVTNNAVVVVINNVADTQRYYPGRIK